MADADGNETDFIGESGMVTCHMGNLNDPFSIQGGLLNQNSYKSVRFIITNLDVSYSYLRVYYSRNTANEAGAI